MPRVCTYDSPATMARECWVDGELMFRYSYRVLPPFSRHPIPPGLLFFGANVGPWEKGRIVGDPSAMAPSPGCNPFGRCGEPKCEDCPELLED